MDDNPKLLRRLNLPMVVFFGMGNILGAGIYVLVGKVAGEAGYNTPLAFLLASVIAGVTALTYSELAARWPESAGVAVYLFKGFNQVWLSTLIGGVIALAGMVSAAAIAHGFVSYFQLFVDLPKELLIISLFLILGGLAIWGITESVSVAALFTLLEIFGLILIIWVASRNIEVDQVQWRQFFTLSETAGFKGIFIGAFLAFYAYVGFEDMVNVAEEVKDPVRNMPRAIILCLIFSNLLYLAVAFVAIIVVPLPELAAGEAPLATVYETATQQKPVIISFIGTFAVINGALIQIIMASRIIYGMANKGWLPHHLARVNSRTNTPIRSTLVVVVTITMLAILFPIVTLAGATSFLLLIVFSLVNLALIFIKRKQPNPPGVITYPIWVPYLGFICSAGFLASQFFFAF